MMNPKDFLDSAPGRPIKTAGGYCAFIVNPLPSELTWSGVLLTLHSETERVLAQLASGQGEDIHPRICWRVHYYSRRE